MKTPKVVIIDDGIDVHSVPKGQLFESYVVEDSAILQEVVYEEMHGSSCYKLFCDYVKVPYHLISIKVLCVTSGTGSIASLVNALKWCKEQDIDIINMSIGTSQYLDFPSIADAIAGLSKTIIVAACNNENTITLPACLPNVIGVRQCNLRNLKGRFVYVNNPYDQIEIVTYTGNYSNSMAAPAITAQICNYFMDNCVPQKNIRGKLMEDAVKDTSFLNYEFYKNSFGEWESIQVPIVVFPVNQSIDMLKALLLEFVKEGYRAVALSSKHATNLEEYIISLNRKMERVSTVALVELYYNFMQPDILFLHIGEEELISTLNELEVDIVIESSWLKLNVEKLYTKVKFYLECEEIC